MQLQIITPEKTLYSAEAEMVVIPGAEGDFGVLPGHAPFISAVRPGVIRIDTADGEKRSIAVAGGIAEAVPERCTVLAEMAIDCSQFDAAAIQEKIAAAQRALEAADSDVAQAVARKELAMAQAMLENR